MDLRDAWHFSGDRRDHRTLEGTGCHHHLVGLDHALRGFDGKARPTAVALDLLHIHAGAYRCVELAGIGFEVIGDLFLAGKGVRVQALELKSREAVVPGRAVGHQRIPAPRTPGFGDAVALKNQVRDAQSAQVFTHGHAGLTGADDKGIYVSFFNCHGCVLLKVGLIQIDHGCRLWG
ncbi:hypothetical protein D3C78_1057730 [compost metagenome]